jgi:hypothetical protein
MLRRSMEDNVMTPKNIIALVLLIAAGPSLSDTLLIDGVEMDAQTAPARPSSGASMATVESRFGAPTERVAAIGQPPIARWEYPGFTVYFEHDKVVHTVVRR